MVEQVYPLANNEQAVGLDLIHDEERGKNTTLAKDSGRQAIDLFEQSAPGEYDAILMDVMMPVRLPASSVHWIAPMPRLCPSWP